MAAVEITVADDEGRKGFLYGGRELCRLTLDEAVVLYPALAYIIAEEDDAQDLGLGFEKPWELP